MLSHPSSFNPKTPTNPARTTFTGKCIRYSGNAYERVCRPIHSSGNTFQIPYMINGTKIVHITMLQLFIPLHSKNPENAIKHNPRTKEMTPPNLPNDKTTKRLKC